MVFWIVTALMILLEPKVGRVIIYFGVYSLVAGAALLILGAPDVAMAEIAISAFATIFFVIGAEKYYNLTQGINMSQEEKGERAEKKKRRKIAGYAVPLVFTSLIFGLVLYFAPGSEHNTYLKEQFITRFMVEMGGENAVTAIYLGYRVYDTIFEALVLVVAVVAVLHMSWFERASIADGIHSDINRSGLAIFIIRIITPLILVLGIYLIVNGFLTPGGGFQGGVAVATFFICRYMIYNIFDLPIGKILRMEELVFVSIVLFAIVGIFLGTAAYIPQGWLAYFQSAYLIIMNALIGIKVACAFTLLFYRYVGIERLEDWRAKGESDTK
jgi:multicomponent Na+:H+ antiporter subunit B